jgi:integrase
MGAIIGAGIPTCVLALFEDQIDGKSVHVFRRANGRVVGRLSDHMALACEALAWTGPKHATPHDLRRSHGTSITGLGFGRDAMNRIENHAEGGIASVYDRHTYQDEARRVQEAVAARLFVLAERRGADNVIAINRGA